MATRKIFLKFNGIEKTLMEWAEHYGIPYISIYHRYKRSKIPEFILFGKNKKPPQSNNTAQKYYLTLENFDWGDA